MDHRTHWAHLRELGCAVCQAPEVHIHHCHGGSIKLQFGIVGMGQRQNHFLSIPLCPLHHVGDWGIDSAMGVQDWEQVFGTQLGMLKRAAIQIEMLYGYSIWEEAGVPVPTGATNVL